jgi:type II secretory pathway predicted ATPase ExeA
MYQHFYGLQELPFELTLNPKYLFLTPRHREALSTLEYGLFSGKSVTVLIGEAGTGKTTLIGAALESEQCRHVSTVHLANPTLTRQEFVEMLSRRFSLSAATRTSKTAMLQELETVLRERRERGQITAIIIDEAQSLSGELLEEIRLLANMEISTAKLLPLVLAGQPELRDRLNEIGLRQLKQRVTLRCQIGAFTTHETAGYISQRVKMAGGDAARLFTREAVILIHDRANGIPRTISVLCDNALMTGFALNRQPVDSEIVLDVAHDFDLGGMRMSSERSEVRQDEEVPPPLSEKTETGIPPTPVEPADDPRLKTPDAVEARRLFASRLFEGYPSNRFSLFRRN